MNRTESCYQKPTKTVTIHSPSVAGQPLRERVVMKTASGEEKTVSRKAYKRWLSDQKRIRRQSRKSK